MKFVKLLVLVALTASGTARAQEHPACRNPAYEYQAHSPEELRGIAATCKSTPVAALYFNRAYHADLVSEAAALAGLIAYADDSSREGFVAYRLYMALLEQLAPVWFPDPAARTAFLNREYDHRVEIAGLRLLGYDHVADHLERNTRIHR